MSNECMSLPHGPVKTCKRCGKKFVPPHRNNVYCSDTCKREHYKEYHADYKLQHGKGARSLPRGRSLAEVSKKAKERGMTYGQYMAHMRRSGHD